MKDKEQRSGFRRVPGGYRRADVNAYILAMDRRAEADGEAQKIELDTLRNRVASLEAECRGLTEKLTASKTEAAALRETLADRDRALDVVSAELTEAKKQLAASSPAAETENVPTLDAEPRQPAAKQRRSFTCTLDFPFRRKNGRS